MQEQWRRYVSAAAGITVLTGVIALSNAGPAISAPIKDVLTFITNDAANPVPVRGDDGTKQVFAYEVKLGWGQGALMDCSSDIPVPDGKRLVIESVSVQGALVGNDHLVNLNIRPVPTGGNEIFASITPAFQGQAVATYYGGSQLLKLYLDRDFMMCGVKTTATAPSFFSAMIWGYLVDRP